MPREFQEQRSLAGYSPQGRKESDTIEQLTLSLSQMIYNVGSVSGIQQSDIVVHTHTHIHTHTHRDKFFFRFFSIISYYKTWCIVPCTV